MDSANHKSSKVKFPVPSGFEPPEHEGDEFDLVCTFRVEGDHLCLTMLGDHKMEGYSDKADQTKDNKPDYSKMAQSIAGSDMSGGAMAGAGGSY